MLSSKSVLEKTGISRATLNNYIKLGMLPKPLVSNPGLDSKGPRQLGFFPMDTLTRIASINQLKQKGLSMSDIANQLRSAPSASTVGPEFVEQRIPMGGSPDTALRAPRRSSDAAAPQITIDDVPHPAYLVNHSFELVWMNASARALLLGGSELPANSDGRSLLQLLPFERGGWSSLLRFHVALAKGRLSADGFAAACRGLDPLAYARLQDLYVNMSAEPASTMLSAPVTLPSALGAEAPHTAYASYFREGMLIVLQPEEALNDALLELLSRRDEVIRTLLRKRLPVLTNLAVMVADLQSSVKICAELPPEEYFELINEIWTTMAPIFRRYHATCGKHVGDGLVYYFFPQPDSDYLANALACAHEVRVAMQKLSKSWQIRKNWFNELYLNTGISEGQEWLGTYQNANGVEFVVLGDTINQAARISDVARFGGIWATKSLIGKMPSKERDRVSYGVRRRGADGRELFVASSFSFVSTLLEQDGTRLDKLKDIATLAITEIVSVQIQ